MTPEKSVSETASLLSSTLQHTATHCNILQHTATHCNTLQHTHTCDMTPKKSVSARARSLMPSGTGCPHLILRVYLAFANDTAPVSHELSHVVHMWSSPVTYVKESCHKSGSCDRYQHYLPPFDLARVLGFYEWQLCVCCSVLQCVAVCSHLARVLGFYKWHRPCESCIFTYKYDCIYSRMNLIVGHVIHIHRWTMWLNPWLTGGVSRWVTGAVTDCASFEWVISFFGNSFFLTSCQIRQLFSRLQTHRVSHECRYRLWVTLCVCVAVCCSVLQCVAVCCSVLQCVAVCCRVFSRYVYSLILWVAWQVCVCCSVLQCVAECCSVLQSVLTLCIFT